jgi:hypothetical protein
LREESEGYAKLVTEFSRFFGAESASVASAAPSAADTTELITKLKSLIGYFDLDPNRVIGTRDSGEWGRAQSS